MEIARQGIDGRVPAEPLHHDAVASVGQAVPLLGRGDREASLPQRLQRAPLPIRRADAEVTTQPGDRPPWRFEDLGDAFAFARFRAHPVDALFRTFLALVAIVWAVSIRSPASVSFASRLIRPKTIIEAHRARMGG